MNKQQIEDYPELKAKFNETMVSDVSHFAVLCDPIKTRKLLTEQQARIDELEKEKYESIEAWNSKLEKLTAENAGLRVRANELSLQLNSYHTIKEENFDMKVFLGTRGFTEYGVKESLAQHDKDVAVKAIDEMLNETHRLPRRAKTGSAYQEGVVDLAQCYRAYLEQLQEQE